MNNSNPLEPPKTPGYASKKMINDEGINKKLVDAFNDANDDKMVDMEASHKINFEKIEITINNLKNKN